MQKRSALVALRGEGDCAECWRWAGRFGRLGQLSFFLLCIQFSREQLDKLQYKTYFQILKENRARGLAEMFPDYHPKILSDFSESRRL